MTAILQQLGIEKLTVRERLALVQAILESVAAEQPQATLSKVKQLELDRRIRDADENPSDELPWEEVEAAALSRFAM